AKNQDKRPSFSSVFGKTVMELAQKDEKIVALTAAMPEGTGLETFSRKFPERFFDVGIAEQHAVNFATGMALEGYKPIVAIYSTFLQRAYDQLYHDVCLMDVPIIFALDRAGIVPADGPTHQGINDIVYLRHLPNMIVMAPKDENELRHMLRSALDYSHPTAISFPKGKVYGVTPDSSLKSIALGKSELLKEGQDLLLAYGNLVYPCLDAAQELEKDGISLAVINARFAKPLDEEIILSYAKAGRTIITAEEGVIDGGFGSAVREMLDRAGRFDLRFKRLGLPVEIYPVGSVDQIKARFKLDTPGLIDQIKSFYS
ncbi:MAG: 1-deoxy-D-xylulose-5-phosphate synthase, partial [Candidatus Aminicenantes bacterium]|nr:1-deoxy-D-xylulose-5-phosphate synthase [Candidatus Aminicenantes bacterium]